MFDKPETTKPPVFVHRLYEPAQDELTVETLKVTGAIPPELCGRYLRDGHNPQNRQHARLLVQRQRDASRHSAE